METWEFRKGERLVITDGPYSGSTGTFRKIHRHGVEGLPAALYMDGDSGAGFMVSTNVVEPIPDHAHSLVAVPFPRTDGPYYWGALCPLHLAAGARPTHHGMDEAEKAAHSTVCTHR